MPDLWDTIDRAQAPQSAPDMWRAPYGVGSEAEMAGAPSGAGNLASGLYQYLGNLAKRSLGSAEEMRQGGGYNPAPIVEAAMLPMGTGAIAGVPVKGAEAVLGAGPIRAYHGSPHDFDAFDLSKIGTGEGAQAYGHGLYFAGNENVARGYRNALTNYNRDDLLQVAPLLPDKYRGSLDAPRTIMDSIQKSVQFGDIKNPGDYLKRYDVDPELVAAHQKAAEILQNRGHMYEVNINADPAHFLDWDKPLREQAHAQSVLEQLGSAQKNRPITPADVGKDVYYKQTQGLFNDTASQRLAEAGIPGIKYLDQGSRGAGQGSSNYVVFDPNSPISKVDILRKYGIAGAAPLAAGFGFSPTANEQRM